MLNYVFNFFRGTHIDSDSDSNIGSSTDSNTDFDDVIILDAPPPSTSLRQVQQAATQKLQRLYELLNRYYGGKDNMSISSVAERLLIPLLNRDFNSMDAWFNDEIINDYFSMLEKQSQGSIVSLSSLYKDYANPDFFERLQAPSKFIEVKSRLKQANLIFWPIPANQHWHLLIIDKSHVPISIYILDGLNGHSTRLFSKYGFELVKNIIPGLPDEEITGEFIQIPQQQNDYDCGSVICKWGKSIAEHFAMNGNISNFKVRDSRVDYTAFRTEVAQTNIDQKINDLNKLSSPVSRY